MHVLLSLYKTRTGSLDVPESVLEEGSTLATRRQSELQTIPQIRNSAIRSRVSVEGRIVSVSIVHIYMFLFTGEMYILV